MTRANTATVLAAMLLASSWLVIGCAEGPIKADPVMISQMREKLLLSEEPGEPVTTLDWRDSQESAETPAETPQEVTLVGQVGGMPNPWGDTEPAFPWRKGEATFFLVDPSTAAEFEAHEAEAGEDHADCPFCAREAANKANAIAAVRFVGSDGEPIKVDARELFGLESGDTVVVRGRASLLGGDLLVLDASGLHIRR